MSQRKITLLLEKTVQERSYEPFKICVGIEEDLKYTDNYMTIFKKRYNELDLFMEEKLRERKN